MASEDSIKSAERIMEVSHGDNKLLLEFIAQELDLKDRQCRDMVTLCQVGHETEWKISNPDTAKIKALEKQLRQHQRPEGFWSKLKRLFKA